MRSVPTALVILFVSRVAGTLVLIDFDSGC
jgi:hypothetical protein